MFKNILKGAFISLILTFICLFIFSCLLTYTTLSESYIYPVIIVITGFSILIGSIVGNKKSIKNGLLNGSIIGMLYIFSIYIISSISSGNDFSLNMYSIIMMLAGIFCGALGGVIGINLGSKK